MKTSHFNFFIENIAHLDIKPENFVGTNVSDQSVLPVFKLIDFGTCEFMENHYIKSITKEILGTDVYIAPEIDRREEYKQAAFCSFTSPSLIFSSTVWYNFFDHSFFNYCL
uniref:Protein kinase domain-containing protein n=1 Tax=Meloidogyne incognita TaxID=6306 RepID=A0A914LYX6_MELIC